MFKDSHNSDSQIQLADCLVKVDLLGFGSLGRPEIWWGCLLGQTAPPSRRDLLPKILKHSKPAKVWCHRASRAWYEWSMIWVIYHFEHKFSVHCDPRHGCGLADGAIPITSEHLLVRDRRFDAVLALDADPRIGHGRRGYSIAATTFLIDNRIYIVFTVLVTPVGIFGQITTEGVPLVSCHRMLEPGSSCHFLSSIFLFAKWFSSLKNNFWFSGNSIFGGVHCKLYPIPLYPIAFFSWETCLWVQSVIMGTICNLWVQSVRIL